MKFFALRIILTAALFSAPSAHAFENLDRCQLGPDPIPNFSWLHDLEVAIEEAPLGGTYDLSEPSLSHLRTSARAAARKCRTRAGQRICGAKRSKYLCYAGVKEALLGAKLVSGRIPGAYAKLAHTRGTLVDEGFQNILRQGFDAQNAPLGAVLVYSGGPEGYGHIETKLGSREYCSDFCKTLPIDRYANRKLIGIYVKNIR